MKENEKRDDAGMSYDYELQAWFRDASPSWGLFRWLRWRRTRRLMEALARYLKGENR